MPTIKLAYMYRSVANQLFKMQTFIMIPFLFTEE